MNTNDRQFEEWWKSNAPQRVAAWPILATNQETANAIKQLAYDAWRARGIPAMSAGFSNN